MSEDKMKINQNIENYLDNYLVKDNIQYATLLTGKWGCGKTYFIKNYIERHKEDYKFVYVSLFGLKSIDEVNELIFSQLHPVLGSKPAKLVTGLFKSAIKIGMPIADVTTIEIDPSNFNFLQQDNHTNSIFVFDDLERSFISYDEILGFINNLTEHNSLKVILVANTEEINGENSRIFDNFKEKVISRTFVVQNDDEGFWRFYCEKYPNLKELLNEIQETFQQYADNNFRLLIQATDDYLDFLENFKDAEFFLNNEFKKEFLRYFLSFCIFYKKSNDFNQLKEEFHKGKHDIFFTKYILPMNVWESILVENKIEVNEITKIFSDLFVFKPPKEQPSWVKLWHYKDLTSDKFYENLSDVRLKFKNLEYDRIDVLEHVYSLLILFAKNGFVQDLTISEIFSIVENYIETNKNSPDWLKHKPGNEFFNNTGLGFANQNDEHVINLKNMIKEKMNEHKEYMEEQHINECLEKILTTIKNGDLDTLYGLFIENETNSVMNKINNQALYSILKERPENIYILSRALSSRYSIDYTINGKTRAKWLIDEKPFVEQLIVFLQELERDEQIDKFYRFRIRENICFFKNDILLRFDNKMLHHP